MNLDDALLIRAVLNELVGKTGMTHAQLAHRCRVSQRRMTHHLFNMEKAGLIDHDAKGKVTLAEAFMDTAFDHADKLNDADAPNANCGPTANIRIALKLKSDADRRYTSDVFNAIFGGPKPVYGGSSK